MNYKQHSWKVIFSKSFEIITKITKCTHSWKIPPTTTIAKVLVQNMQKEQDKAWSTCNKTSSFPPICVLWMNKHRILVPIFNMEKSKSGVPWENARFNITQFQVVQREHVFLVLLLKSESKGEKLSAMG